MSEASRKVVIVAAGRGRRLGPETENVPKCMVRVAGQPILHWQLHGFAAVGLAQVLVVRGYLGVNFDKLSPKLAKSLGLSSDKGVIITNVQKGSPADKAGLKVEDVIVQFDGKPVNVLFTLISPTIRAHLHVLSSLAFALRDPGFQDVIGRQASRDVILAEARRVASKLVPPAETSGKAD